MKSKLKLEIVWWYHYIKILFKSIIYRDSFVIIGTPIHGNIGDQAIALAEYHFLNDYFPRKKILEIPSYHFIHHSNLFKIIVRKKNVLVHGGGFLGTLWMNEEKMFRKILLVFPNHKFIVFPQTLYFGQMEWERKEFEKSKAIYTSANKLLICTREKYSFQFMDEEMRDVDHCLIPDMVLYLAGRKMKKEKKGVLLCMRSDKEKEMSLEEMSIIDKVVRDIYGTDNIKYTDTMVDRRIYARRRKAEVEAKLTEFSNSELIITDRLHGMVFAAITGTPCVVFKNCNYKVEGVYEWIKELDYISFAKNIGELEEMINKVKMKVDCTYNNKELLVKYDQLAEFISGEKYGFGNFS